MSGQLLGNLLLFGRVLREMGLDVQPRRMMDLVEALEHVGIGRRSDFYHAACCLLVHRREDLARFDRAFEVFWRKPRRGESRLDLAALGERRRFRPPRLDPLLSGESAGSEPAEASERSRTALRWTYSAREVLRRKDFGELSPEEEKAVRELARGSLRRIAPRESRRWRAGRGALPDVRRTLRASVPRGGEILEWERREPKLRQRSLVVLADISGSMESYTRVLLLFLCGVLRALKPRAEAFVFGTRLTRVTRELSGEDPERALADVSRAVSDWSGGTRIGEAVRAFNREWTRRLPRGAIVLLVSDGWDRGDPDLLRRELARLQRSSFRLVWLNPLLGSPGYQPLARGMQAALPYVDDFLPVHNLVSLEQLAHRLEELPARRPVRKSSCQLSAFSSRLTSPQGLRTLGLKGAGPVT